MARKLLDTAEVAERLRFTQKTVRNMAARGEIPAFRLGNWAYRFDEKALDRWLESQAVSNQTD